MKNNGQQRIAPLGHVGLGMASLLLSAATLVQAAELELLSECRPAGPVVTLGDVARVIDNDAEQVRVLSAIELFPSPPPGEQRFVGIRQIQDLLVLRGVNLVEHRFAGSSRVAISTVEAVPIAVPVEAQAEPVRPQTRAIVVATRALPRGAIVGTSDVRLERTTMDEAAADSFRTIEEVIGHETTRGIAAGKALLATSVRPPILVRRGEVVTVYVRSPGIRVRSIARARDDGSLGDLIALESFEDRKTILARVSGMQEVEIYGRAVRTSPTMSDLSLSSDNDLAGN